MKLSKILLHTFETVSFHYNDTSFFAYVVSLLIAASVFHLSQARLNCHSEEIGCGFHLATTHLRRNNAI